MTRRRLEARDMGAHTGNKGSSMGMTHNHCVCQSLRKIRPRQRTFSVFELLLSALQIAAVAHAPTAAPISAEVRLLVEEADIESSCNCRSSGAS